MSRPGLPAGGVLNARERATGLGLLLEIVSRMTGTAGGVQPIAELGALAKASLTAVLGGGATLAQTITKVNELQACIVQLRTNEDAMQAKIDAIIQRLQED